MIPPTPTPSPLRSLPELDASFAQRLEAALPVADRERKRRVWQRRLRALTLIVALAGPIVAWRLMLSFPDGPHVVIDAATWLAFGLDVGVHLDTALLSYLGLQALPSIVGIFLLALVTGWLLQRDRTQS